MKKFRLLSAFLSVTMAVGMSAAAIPVNASSASVLVPGYNYTLNEPTIDYLSQSFDSPEEKLATMTKVLPKENEITTHGMELYIEPISGEVAYRNSKTGQIIFSNPFNVSEISSTDRVKGELLSQIAIKYIENGTSLDLFSFDEACMRGQITVKEGKTGVRVEYVIGREETRKLVPKHIEKSRFETLILANITDPTALARIKAWYTEQFPDEARAESERKYRDMVSAYPITKEGMSIYVFDESANDRELDQIEGYIKEFCPDYTYDTLEEDHAITKYEGSDKAPVLFRLSLEYSLDEDGNLDVRLPANGIRFDESTYQLTSISVLPWFGAASSSYEGYTMIPDGSGALIRVQDVSDQPLILTGKVYGQDYAYQKIEGQNKEVMRLPVYGIYESNNEVEFTQEDNENGRYSMAYEGHKENAFLAIIEEGESLAEITAKHGATQYPYATVYSTFYPRPTDTYDLSETISVSSAENAMYTVVSDRKYTGSYRLKYMMLTGENEAGRHGDKHYEADYVGMAKAYREYLINKGVLTEKVENETDIPLYIESFGAIETIQKILSMPVEVLKPLTTFDDLKSMYEKLSAEGINNVNFKLNGFANGGLNSTAPYNVDFVKEVGGNKGFTELVNEYAAEKGIGIYPDFDFANVGSFGSFDGVSNKKHLVKTMDGRYTTKRYYDATLQSFERGYSLAISPSVYDYFFDNFEDEYSALKPMGVSVSTLGTDLNSDFDEDNPYNREETKAFTAEMLADLENSFGSVMIDGGNAYALGYADHILNVPLDSSRYSRANEAIPFMGMVLHGCVDFAGAPINMAGDTMYELLKAIENGASLYFTLSSQNTALLKEDEQFNKYYSVNFDIWFKDEADATDTESTADIVTDTEDINSCDTVVELYSTLNAEIRELQDKQIIGHEFVPGRRIPEAGEEIAKTGDDENTAVISDGESEFDPLLSDEGRIVLVTYEGGKSFLLNYNSFAVTVELDGAVYEVEPINYIVIS